MEKISEEFAFKLLRNIVYIGNDQLFIKKTIELWKQKGYIEQSREEEIKEYVRNHTHSVNYEDINIKLEMLNELVEILDNKE